MRKRTKLNKAGSIKRPKAPEKRASAMHYAFERQRLLHELEADKVELEAQNRELRETHQHLELSRDRYADLYDFAPVGYVTLDDKGLIQEINLTAAGMLGVERSRLIGLPFTLHIVKDYRPAFLDHLRKLKRASERAATELGLTVKGGGTIQVELRCVPVLDARRKTRLFRSTLTDITARNQVQQALRNNEARLRAILDAAVEGIVTIDERGFIEWFNPAAARMFGYTAEEAIGQNVSFLMPAPYRQEHDNYLAHYRQSGERKIIGIGREVAGQRKDGSTFPLDLSVSEVQLADRRIFAGILRDITERKRAEEALRVSEERFRLMADNAPVMVWISGTDKLCTWFNRSWLAFTGRSMEQELGNGWVEAVHPEDVARCLETYSTAFDARRPFTMEYRLRRNDGAWCWLLDDGIPLYGSGGTFSGYIGSCIDINERKQAEDAVRRSEALLANAQQIAHLGSYEIPIPGTGGDHWSEETFRILGLDPTTGELSRSDYSARIVHPEDRARFQEAFEKSINECVRFDLEYRIVRPDGSTRHVHSIAEPKLGADGKEAKLVGTLQDVTERKELEKEILEISEREQSRIGQDLHDGLCQHLAGIEFRLLELKQKLKGKSNKRVAETTELAKLVRQGIEQTRTLARGLSPVMLEADGLMNALQELAIDTEKTFKITCSLNCLAPVLIHDNVMATHLYRIAQEAVQNAVRHGKAKFIVINLLTHADRIVLGVKDDGVGFPKTPRKHKGMGLRVMQYRAGMVGGSLAVQHESDGGTSVVCSLRASGSARALRDQKGSKGRE